MSNSAATPTPLSYKDAGVDIDAGDALVERIKPLAKKTMREGVLAGIGGFGALRSAVFPDRIKHHREHRDEDHRADDEHHPVQIALLLSDACHSARQV